MEEILEEVCEKDALLEDAAAQLAIDQSGLYISPVRFGFEKRWVKPEPQPEEAQT